MSPLLKRKFFGVRSVLLFFVLVITIVAVTCSTPFATAVVVLSGNLNITWDWQPSGQILWTFDAPLVAGNYMAVSVSASAMAGKGVACQQPASGTTTATCSAITTSSYGVSSRTDASLSVVSASEDGARAYTTVSVDAAAMDVAAGTKRIIFAIGSWSAGLPTKHASTADRSSTSVVFVAPPTTSTTTAGSTTTTPTTTSTASSTTGASTSSAGTTTTSSSSSPSPTTSSTIAPSTSSAPPPPPAGTTTTTPAATTTMTTAAATTTTSSPSSTSSSSPQTTSVNTVSVLAGSLNIGHSITNGGASIIFYLDAPLVAGNYMAVSVSASAMAGKGVACKQPASGTTTATCSAITTTSYGVSSRAGATVSVVSASTTATRAYVAVQVDNAAAMDVVAGASKRVIFAIGAWSDASSLPTQHAATADRGSTTIAFESAASTSTSAAASAGSTTTAAAGPSGTTPSGGGGGGGGGGPTSTTITAAPPPTTTTTTTTAAPTTTITITPTPANNGSSLSQFGGNLVMDWSISSSSADIVLTLSSKNSQYSAIAWADSGMGPGTGLACVVRSDTSKASCRVFSTSDVFSIAATDTASSARLTTDPNGGITDVKLAAATGGWAVTVTIAKSRLGIAASRAASSARRMIFAQGSWDLTNDMPLPHTSTSRSSAAAVDLYAGTSSGGDAHGHGGLRFPIALAVSFVWVLILAGVGAALKATHEASTPTLPIVLKILVLFSLVGSMIACILAYHGDAVEKKASAPWERAVGGGIAYVFMVLLLPTRKYLNLGVIAGCSFERILPFHVFGGFVAFIMIITHMSMMMSFFSKSIGIGAMLRGENLSHAIMPALFGLILVFIMIVTGLLRRKFFKLFRITHFLAVPALVLFCVHYPALGFCLIPGALLMVVEHALDWNRTVAANATVKLCDFDKGSSVTKLVVQVQDPSYTVEPGQFAFLYVHDASCIPHPFTIAMFDEKQRMLTFFIKQMDNGPFTTEVAKLAAAAGGITSVSVSRPLGNLGLRLDVSPVVFLVAGGIGVTPMLNIAQHLSKRSARGDITGVTNLHLVWSVRDASLIDFVADGALREICDNVTLASSSSLAAGGAGGRGAMKLDISIYLTKSSSNKNNNAGTSNNKNGDTAEMMDLLLGGGGGSSPLSSRGGGAGISSLPSDMVKKINGRPQFDKLFSAAKQQHMTAKTDTTSVFSCGPAPFMESVKSSCSKCDCLLHEETFEM